MIKSRKRIVSMLTILAMVLAMMPAVVFADSAETASVSVTIADKGKLVVTQEDVAVTDTDGDGALTINDALYAAHEAVYEGGAAAGYSSAMSSWGLSITKLWGDTSGSYGYYVNNASAWGLTDPVEDGDSIYAFVYTDQIAWSDTYSFFDKNTVTAEAGEEVTLTLSCNGYDSNWNTVVTPLAGAAITVDGAATDVVTDAEGKAVIKMEAGSHVISATAADKTLVPPVCVATVTPADTTEEETPVIPEDEEQDISGDTEMTPEDEITEQNPEEETVDEDVTVVDEETVEEEESEITDSTPQTGDDFNMTLYGIVALAALAAAAFCLRRKTCK